MKTIDCVKNKKQSSLAATLKSKALINDFSRNSQQRDILQFKKTVNAKSRGLLSERNSRNIDSLQHSKSL